MAGRRRMRHTWRSLWQRASLPVKVGAFFGLLGAVLASIGLARGAFEPFSWQGLATAIVLAGGSWGLVSWALATAMIEAGRDEEPQGEKEVTSAKDEGHRQSGSRTGAGPPEGGRDSGSAG